MYIYTCIHMSIYAYIYVYIYKCICMMLSYSNFPEKNVTDVEKHNVGNDDVAHEIQS